MHLLPQVLRGSALLKVLQSRANAAEMSAPLNLGSHIAAVLLPSNLTAGEGEGVSGVGLLSRRAYWRSHADSDLQQVTRGDAACWHEPANTDEQGRSYI